MVGHLLAGILISSLLITLKTRWKLPLLSQTAWKHLPTAALAMRLDCWVRTSRRPDWANFRFWKRCFFVSLVLHSVHNTVVTCKLNFPSLLIIDLLVHQREAVGRLAQLSATRTPVRVPESRLSSLRVDLRLEAPSDRQSIVVANTCAARLFHIVRSQWHGGAWSWSSTSTFFMSEEAVWVWLGRYRLAWRQRAQRAHEEHVVLSMNDFDEQPNQKEQVTSSSVTCCCLLAARAYDPWRKTDELFQISAP